MLAFSFIPFSHANATKEETVKAAILYNLARFSEWKSTSLEEENNRFWICATSHDPMIDALNTLEGKLIEGNKVTINILHEPSDNVSNCRILYLSKKVEEKYDLNALTEKGILTVGERHEFLSKGGGIAIIRKDNKLGFSINKTVMLKANVIPSSKILKLARDVF